MGGEAEENSLRKMSTTTDPTWIEGVGHRALRSPSALRARLRFAHATLTAAVSVPGRDGRKCGGKRPSNSGAAGSGNYRWLP